MRDDVLYHYCSVGTFCRIVESEEVWLTDIFCMNDSAEHYWLRRVAKELLEAEYSAQIDDVSEYLKSKLFPENEETELYCFCLSKDGDLLSQWRAYADDGRGVAIGFSRDYLSGLAADPRGILRLEEIIYDPAEQKAIIREIVDGNRSMCKRFAHEPDDSLPKDLAQASGRAHLWHQAVRCKHPGFREEQEVRLICDPRGKTPVVFSERKYRERDGLLIPYRVLKLEVCQNVAPIRRIVFGPKNSFGHDQRAALALLQDHGHSVNDIELRQSEIPYW